MKYIPHKVIREVPKLREITNIFFFDAILQNNEKNIAALYFENTSIYFPRKKSLLKKYRNGLDPSVEGYGFLREDGVEIQLIHGKNKGEYLLIADPSNEKNIAAIRLDLANHLDTL
jgi:predicted Zn-dependent protease